MRPSRILFFFNHRAEQVGPKYLGRLAKHEVDSISPGLQRRKTRCLMGQMSGIVLCSQRQDLGARPSTWGLYYGETKGETNEKNQRQRETDNDTLIKDQGRTGTNLWCGYISIWYAGSAIFFLWVLQHLICWVVHLFFSLY